jgi:hypothetical protein
MAVRSGLFLPIIDELADPVVLGRLSAEAEEVGRPRQSREGGRDARFAEQWPAGARVCLGSDQFGNEFSLTGEELDDRKRARMLDESLEILTSAWSGEPVHHHGEHLRRAARFQGFMPDNLEHSDQPAEIVAALTDLHRKAGKDVGGLYDVVAALPARTDPRPYLEVGATWWLVEFEWDSVTVDQVRGVIRDGPAGARSPAAPEASTRLWPSTGVRRWQSDT